MTDRIESRTMSALAELVAREHRLHGDGCACGTWAVDMSSTHIMDDYRAHIAAVTEAAVREQVARDILAQRERYSCTGLEDAAYDDAARIARGGAS